MSSASEFAAADALVVAAAAPSIWNRLFGMTTWNDAARAYDAIGNKYIQDSVQAYTAAAECYLQSGNVSGAVRAFENAANASTDPSESIRILTLASVASLSLTPDLIRLHTRIAEIAESIGDFDIAINRFREAANVANIQAEIHHLPLEQAIALNAEADRVVTLKSTIVGQV